VQVKAEPTADCDTADDKNDSYDNYDDSYYNQEGGMYTDPGGSLSYTDHLTDDATSTQVQYSKPRLHKVMLAKLRGSSFPFTDHLIVESDCVAWHGTCDKEVTWLILSAGVIVCQQCICCSHSALVLISIICSIINSNNQ